MDQHLPPWLKKFVTPLLGFLAVLTPILKIFDYLESKNALAFSITGSIIAGAWCYRVWTIRLESSIYGATVKRLMYGKSTRIGSALVFLGFILVVAWLCGVNFLRQPLPISSIREIPFTVHNGLSQTLIWIPSSAEVQVLESETGVTDRAVVTVRVRIEMPNTFKFSGKPQIDPHATEVGVIKFPEHFDFNQYIERGLSLRLLIIISPSDKLIPAEVLLDKKGLSEGFRINFSP